MQDERYRQFIELDHRFELQSHSVPQEIRLKLAYISSKIKLQTPNQNSSQQADLSQLEELPPKALIIIFNAIAKTLFEQDTVQLSPCKHQQSNTSPLRSNRQSFLSPCKIRFPGPFAELWKEGTVKISYRRSQISVSKAGKIIYFTLEPKQNSTHTHNKIMLQTDTQLMKMDPKTIAILFSKQVKVWIKFQNAKMSKFFTEAYKELQSSILNAKLSEIKGRLPEADVLSPFLGNRQRSQTLQASKDETLTLMISQLNSNVDFEVHDYKKNCVVKIHKTNPELQIQLRLDHTDEMEDIMSAYVNQIGWNTTLKSEQLIAKLDSNIFLIRRVYKPYSRWFSYERQVNLLIQFERISKTKGFLIEQTVEESQCKELKSQKPNKTRAVKATMKATVIYEALQKEKGCKLTIKTSFRGNGYCGLADDKQMLLEMYKDISYFENYYRISRIKKDGNKRVFVRLVPNKEERPEIIDLEGEECEQLELPMRQMQLQADRVSHKSSQLSGSVATVLTDATEQPSKLIEMVHFKKMRPLKPTYLPTHQYFQLLKKRHYESSYLYSLQQGQTHQKFDLDCKTCWDNALPSYSLEAMMERGGQYEVSPEKQLVMINFKLLESQRKTLSYILKQMGANLLSGKSVFNVSLPVDIFESQAILERSAASFGYAPCFLQPVCQLSPLQQIKNVFGFIASIPTLQLNMLKPFNPILGQTLQAYIKGIPICYEQISHHPPVSSYYMESDQFKIYGNLVAYANVGLNNAVGGNGGLMHIELRNGSKFQCYFPPCQIAGLIYGNRKFRQYGRGYVLERHQRLLCEFSIEKQKKGIYETNSKGKRLRSGDLIGGVFKVNDKFLQDFDSVTNVAKFTGLTKTHIIEKLAEIGGVWFEELFVNGELIPKGKPYPLEYQEPVLPSDSNYRLDILYHRIGDQKTSQKEKQVLQELQRADRKLRQRGKKNRK